MSEIKIRFTADKQLLEDAIKNGNLQIKEQGDQLRTNVSAIQSSLFVTQSQILTKTKTVEQEIEETRIRLGETVQQLKASNAEVQKQLQLTQYNVDFSGEKLRKSLDDAKRLRAESEANSKKISQLEERIKILNEMVAEANAQADIAEKKSVDIKTRLSQATQTMSAIAGFIALYGALTEEQLDIGFQAVLSIALNSLNQIILLMAVAQTTGNLPLFLALGSLASGTASTINTIKSLHQQANARLEAQRRRSQNRKIES